MIAKADAEAKAKAEATKKQTEASKPASQPSKPSNNTPSTPSKPARTDKDYYGVALAIWNGNYGWGTGNTRVSHLQAKGFDANRVQTLQILVGCNHTTKKGMEIAKRIEQLFKDRCAEYKKEYSLNFGVYYTPAENLCFTAMSKFRNKYGEIPNVSDKKFFTNSMHVPVWEEMSPFEKIDIEAELTGYSSAGCITYVELPSSVKQNIDALEEIVNYAMDKDIPYFAVNVPNDMCTECGYTDEIGDECPICGCRKIRRLRRVTGYLTGDYIEAFNEGKRQEVDYRVKHFNNALKAKTEKNESH